MRVKVNEDEAYVKKMRKLLEKNDGYCPCRLEHTDDTRCLCKQFRDDVAAGKTGECHCGLYIAVDD